MAEQSLFGTTPEALQASRAAALQAQALQYAKLDPFQRANMSIYQGAGQLGGAIGGMLGGQDPEMMRIKQRQSLMQSLDLTSPESLKQGIQAAMQSNDYTLASELNARLQATAKAALEGRKTEAEIGAKLSEKLTSEQKNAAALADASGKERGTPEWTAVYKESLTGLTAKPGDKISFGTDAETAAKELYGKSFTTLNPEQAAAVNKLVQTREIAKKTAGAPRTVIPLGDVFNKIATTKDAENKQAAWKTAGESYTLAVPLLSKLDDLYANLPKTYTGNLANITIQLGKSLSALGVPVDVNKLSNSEYAEAVGAEVVQSIAKNFPGSQSNVELQQLIKSKFNILQELPTIRRILTDVRTKTQAGVLTYEQLSKKPEEERYRADPNLLNGTNYKKLNRLNKLMDKSINKTITADEITEAKKLQEELK